MSLSPPAFERRGSLLRRKKASGLPSSRHSLKTERESSLMDKVEPNSSLDTMSNVRTFNGERPATAFRPLLSDTSSRAASSANLRANGSHYLATPMTSYGPTSMPILPGSYLPYLPPSVDEEHIYESLHNARWESMKKEEARLQRESTRWNSPSPPGSLASSREGSVGPGGASNVWGHPEPSAEIMVGTSKPPRSLYLHKTNQDNFGFTLRHCIVYAPEVPDNPNVQPETKETIFVKSVKPEGPAYRAGMRVGDRIMSVNGEQVAGKTYSHVVQSIKNVPDVLFLTVLPQEEDVIQKYFYDIAQNPETNQPIKGSPALSHKSFLSSRGPMSDFMPTDSSEHLYAEPAQIREYRNPSPMSHYHDPDRLALNRIKREFEMKEKFMNRPPEDFNTTLVTSEELRESPRPKKSSRSRKQKSDSPSRVPRPSETFVDGMMCSKGESPQEDTQIDLKGDDEIDEKHDYDDHHVPSIINREYEIESASQTPESLRKRRHQFGPREDQDQEDYSQGSMHKHSSSSSCSIPEDRGKSIDLGRASGNEDSDASRKSSLSSGRKKSLFPGTTHRDSKQFAVTFFVNEHDKTKLVDILHKAKNVISKKVEKVMGRKVAAKTTSSVSNAQALTSILETWVKQEEEEGRQDQSEMAELVQKQKQQVHEMHAKGLNPPVKFDPSIPTVVSPVPEEDEENDAEDECSDDEAESTLVSSDMTIQEVKEDQDNFLKPPQRFQLSRSTTPVLVPSRSLSPADGVSRLFSRCDADIYPPCLRRPSSHYDESAQAASSRPSSPRPVPFQSLNPPSRLDIVSPPPVSPTPQSEVGTASSDGAGCVGGDFRSTMLPFISRPESMTVPIGGVWRPNDSDYEETQLFSDEECKRSQQDGGSSLSSPKSHSQSSQNEIENYAPSNALIMDRIREEGADSETVTTAPHHRYGSHDHTSSRRSSAASETPPPLPSSSSSTTTITTTTSASQDLSRYPFETRQFLHHHHPSSAMSQIRRRPKPILTQEETDEKNLRRASYLRATKNEEYVRNVPLDPCVITTSADTDYEMVTSTSKPLLSSSSTTTTKKLQSSGAEKYPVSSNSIQRIKTRFGEKTDSSQEDLESHGPLQAEEIKQGWLQIKVMALEGKKANDRSWKNVYVVIRSNRMFMYKDKKVATENPQSTEEIPVPLAESYVDVADDYTKRKNVFRIKTNLGSEYLCQADQEQDMKEWITAIEDSNVYFVVDERKDSGPGSVLLPGGSGSSVRGLKKFTSFRHRSPSLHSPAAKSRKPSQDPMPSRDTPAQTSHQVPSNSTANSMTSSVPNLDSAGPMGGACPTEETKRDKKTLMGKMAKQWKKIQHGSPATPQTVVPESGSLGVPLESCPMSEDPNHERVPKLVTTCCKIVEERGLEIVGVYRVPGNTAAVNCLTEQLKHADPEEAFKMDDYRWNDVNVVSSLLKSFFRKLPEPLFTAELYPRFIKASMIEDSGQRLHTLKRLIQALPPINLDTLEYVMRHLTKVIEFCNVNKMEVKNLAIVFGPTLVRPDGDDMMLMVTDMAQQCRIIESILAHAEWFFNNEPVDEHAVSSFVLDLAEPQTVIARTAQESVLLTNLQKLEYQGKVQSPSRDMSAKEVVSSIISAAQRKKNRPSAPSHKVSPNPIMINSQRMEPERLQTPPMSENSSRRNSESMMQVTPTDSSPSPNLGVASNNERRRTSSRSGEASYLNLPSSSYMKKISASAENINRVCNLSVQQLQSSPSRKFPLTESTTTYQNESNRESPGKSHFRSEILPGPESPTLDAWKSNSDQILLQDPYPTQAYNSDPADAKSRFLNQTYFKRNADPRLPINRVHSASNLMEGLAEFSSSKTPPIASPLKRHQFQKSATESLLIVDEKKTATKKLNDDGNKTRTVRTVTPTRDQEKEEREKHEERLVDDSEHGKLISQLNTFDESLRLLIDPNSQSDPDSHVKAHPQRRMSSITVLNPSSKPPSSSSSSSAISNAKTTRSISVGGRPPPLALKDKRNQVSRKSELKRGKLVDKKKQPSPTLINLKRNDSLNKKEKQNVNIRQKAAEKENNNAAQKLWEEHLLKDPTAASKIIKTLSNQCQIKRRNTVGSPNDIENQSRKSHFSMNNHRRTAPMTIGHRWSSMDSAGSNEDEPTEPEEPRTEEDEDEHIVGKESENKRLREFALAISEVGSQRSSEVRNGSPAKDNSNPPPKMPSLLESQV